MRMSVRDDAAVVQKSRSLWLVGVLAGLAVGFLVGREVAPRSGSTGAVAAKPAASAKAYKSEAQFPPGWLKSADLVNVAGLSFAGLNDEQKAVALQALNTRNCECGCGKGTIAACARNDSACGRSPKLSREVVAKARAGENLTALLAHLDRENPAPSAPAPAQPDPGVAAPSAAAADQPAGGARVTLLGHHPRKGPRHAKVTIVEFSDFQCPFCSRVLPTIKQITDAYPNDVAFVFVNFPLRSIHPQAADAARAFMAAHRQGKAWPMHDKLFENQQALQPADLERYAREVGLDLARWKRDMADPAVDELVREDEALAMKVGAQGTPAFYVNGKEPAARDFASWKALIEREIARADALLGKGVKRENLYARLLDDANKPIEIDLDGAPSKGPARAPVTIVAFSEFQCPYCSRAVPGLKQVEEAYPGKVRIAFKHLLIPGHQQAPLAAEASLAAHEQGKFWPYHDKLFANQQALERPALESYAQELGLDMKKFKAALDSGKHKTQVDRDMQIAASLGVTGTPTFFVNGKKTVGAKGFPEWKTLIDGELQARR
jgi:protein-disulfide isomerase